MRTIKFRAWDGVSMGTNWELSQIPQLILSSLNHDCKVFLMQFTGLVDKMGKEIYEGDIVDYAVKKMICSVCSKKDIESRLKLHSEQYCPGCGTKTTYSDFVTRAEVVYDKAAFGYKKTYTEGSYQCWPVYANEVYIEWVEVVGNIHEGIAKVESNVHPVIADVLNQFGLTV